MSKYNFHDLRVQYNAFNPYTKDIPLPVDINTFVEHAALQFKNENLMKMLTDARERKWFGDAMFLDGGIIKAKFEINMGICTQFYLYHRYDDNVFFQKSIFNDNIDMRKPNRETGKVSHIKITTVTRTESEKAKDQTNEVKDESC